MFTGSCWPSPLPRPLPAAELGLTIDLNLNLNLDLNPSLNLVPDVAGDSLPSYGDFERAGGTMSPSSLVLCYLVAPVPRTPLRFRTSPTQA